MRRLAVIGSASMDRLRRPLALPARVALGLATCAHARYLGVRIFASWVPDTGTIRCA